MWRFRKSFSPLPGVRLTLSPSGITTSVGAGPLRITAGSRGAHLTATVPGTGFSFKTRLSESPSSVPAPSPAIPWPQREPPRIGSPHPQFEPQVEQIESAGSAVLTTPGISEFRRLLDLARLQHAETASELERAKAIDRAATDHYLSWKNGWLLRHLRKKRFAALAEAAEDGAARRVELEEQEVLARLGTQIDIPDAVAKSFSRFSDAFAQLSRSSRIWDTVSHRAVNQVSERTLASRAIERKPVQFRLGTCAAIQSDWQVPHLENANGGDLYLYPLFIVYFAGERNFALLEYKEVELKEASTRFIEAEAVPNDSKIVDRTWAKTNKDGSPDRRYKENYEIPVVQYGKLTFRSATGLNEEYMFSNAAATETFSKEWNSLVQGIARGA